MNTDKPLGAALLVLGAGGVISAAQISVRTFNNDPGPKLFPMMACAILIICGLGLLLRKSNRVTPAIPATEWRRGLTMAGLLVGYALGLWLVGFHAATFIGGFALYWAIAGPEKRSLMRGAIYALLLTLGVHLVFKTMLGTFLPQGFLF
ncbi:tripartite tricarboxylate transporter TctB family protein [Paracoccus aurantiacus]|nr:tripartite tricarboxylate transporter TctB family protein [Paracoccus aurantiacus]